MSELISDEKISEKIIEIVKTEEPESVEKLLELVNQKFGITKDIALKQIIELENHGRLRLSQTLGPIKKFNAYLFSSNAFWFWIIITLSISTTISVFTIKEEAMPYIYIRYILGFIFVIFILGFSLIKTLFPIRKIGNIERSALSIGMSLALVPLIGLLLNYTP